MRRYLFFYHNLNFRNVLPITVLLWGIFFFFLKAEERQVTRAMFDIVLLIVVKEIAVSTLEIIISVAQKP